MNTTTKTWDRAYVIGQQVRDTTIKAVRVGVITGLDPFGYIVEFSSTRTVFMPQWNLAPAPHKTRTTEPVGWHVSNASAGRDDKHGMVADRTSVAICSCGWSKTADSRQSARAAANLHKSEVAA